MSEKFDIFFSGQIMDGQDESKVRTKLERIFNANPKQLERLFSGRPVKIKSGVDIEKATKYRVTFRGAGALIEIKPATATAPASAPTTKDKIELLPAKTGSLIDCAPKVVPAEIPNIDNISLGSNAGSLDNREPPPPANIDTEGLTLNPAHSETFLDEHTPPPPAVIDTGSLSLSAANTGTLEDCQRHAEPAEIPDISALEMVEPKVRF